MATIFDLTNKLTFMPQEISPNMIPDIDSLDLVAAVDLNYAVSKDTGKPVYQFVYASQLYGTFFTVYAHFAGTNSTTGYDIKTITLRLVNYKGIINMGFAKDSPPAWDARTKRIYFHIRGAIVNPQAQVDFGTTPLTIKKGSHERVVFHRILHPLAGFDAYQERQGSSGIQLKINTPETELFDSEFNERDGLDFYSRDLRPGMYGYTDDVMSTKVGVAGRRCNTSDVNIFF